LATLISRGLKEGALIEIARRPPNSNRAGVAASIVYADRDLIVSSSGRNASAKPICHEIAAERKREKTEIGIIQTISKILNSECFYVRKLREGRGIVSAFGACPCRIRQDC